MPGKYPARSTQTQRVHGPDIARSGEAGFARITLATLAALAPPEHEVVIHGARLSAPDYDICHSVIHPNRMTSALAGFKLQADPPA